MALDDRGRRALAWFAAEHPVLLAAVRQAPRRASTRTPGSWRWTLVHLPRPARPLARPGRRAARSRSPRRTAPATPPGEAASAHQLGRACIRLRDYDDAATHLELALDRYGRIGDDAGRARVHGNLGFIADRQARPRDAIEHLLRSLDLLRATGDQAGQGTALNEPRLVLRRLGRAPRGAGLLPSGPGAAAADRRPHRRGLRWDSIGFVHHQLGEHEPAADCYRQALELWREIGDRYGESETQTHLGDLHRAAGAPEEARACWLAALTILEDLGHPDADQVRQRVAQP